MQITIEFRTPGLFSDLNHGCRLGQVVRVRGSLLQRPKCDYAARIVKIDRDNETITLVCFRDWQEKGMNMAQGRGNSYGHYIVREFLQWLEEEKEIVLAHDELCCSGALELREINDADMDRFPLEGLLEEYFDVHDSVDINKIMCGIREETKAGRGIFRTIAFKGEYSGPER